MSAVERLRAGARRRKPRLGFAVGIYGGNDGRAVLLTEKMYDLLHSPDLKIDPRWMPYPPHGIRKDGSLDR
jgi:hypothetical protein